MSEELRKRRDALRAELRAIERELDGVEGSTLDPQLHAALAGASEFVALVDDEGRAVHINRMQPGVPPIVGRPVLDYIDQPYHEHLTQVIEQARRLGHPCPARIDARGPQGPTGAYHLWAVPLPVPVAGATLTLIGFEATHLQRVERALQDERSVVHSLMQVMPDTILIVDREHRITFVNRLHEGVTMEEVIGADVTTFLPEPSRELARRAIDAVFEGGAGTSYESQVELPAGTLWFFTRVVPVMRDGAVVRACLVGTEITEQRERETQLEQEREALRQSEARFRTLVEHAPEALVILDADTGRFLEVSDSACELFGLDRAELVQRSPIDLSPRRQPDGRPSEQAAFAHIERAHRDGSAQFEWTHGTGDGRELVCEVRLVALPHERRRLLRGSVLDISDRKRAERERALLQEELFQAQKMQAIGQLTGGVAHDFNNLLTVILSHVELLRLQVHREAKVAEHAHEIRTATLRAASLTQQLLAFARRQPLKPQRIDLAELVSRMQRLLERALGETIVVVTTCADALWDCEADRAQLENAILNLALNARDAMPAGGTLSISMENRLVDASEGQAEVSPGRYAVITVADDGTGMPADVVGKAFEPFFTTKEVGRGSGLGLSMVYGFVKQSGGHVEIESTPGKGTRVSLHLPAADGAALETAPPPHGTESRGQGELIVVVEDEEAVRVATVEALRQLGYRTVDASDAAGALSTLEQVGEVALVLTDVVLAGGVSGVQLAERIAERHPPVPVVFMSGYTKDVVARDGVLPEGVQLLMKPFTQGDLAAVIRAAVDRGTTA